MDPELTEQLNESMRQLSDMMAQLNSTLAGTVKSMNSATAAGKIAADASKQSAERQTNSANQVVSGQTKMQAAHEQASVKMVESSQNFSRAADSAKHALVSFTKAVLSGEEGVKKYGSTLGSLGDGALSLGRNFGLLGTVVGAVIKGFSVLAEQSLTQTDNLLKASDDLARLGAANSFSTDEIYKMGHQLGLTSGQLEKMTGPMKKIGDSFTKMGDGAGDATKKFVEMATSTEKVRAEFRRMGYNDAERIQAQADFIESMNKSGISVRTLEKSSGGLQKASLDYIKNLTELSNITGNTVESERAKQEEATANMQFQLYLNRMNQKIANATTEEEKKKYAAQVQQAKDAVRAAQETGGSQGAASMAQYITQGYSTIGIAQQAMLGTMSDYQRAAKQVNDGTFKQAEFADFIGTSGDKMRAGINNLTEAASNSEEFANTLTGGLQNMTNLNVNAGRNYKEAQENAEKNRKELEAGKGKAAQDPLQAFRDTMVEGERQLSLAFDDLIKQISPTINSLLKNAMDGLIETLKFVKNNFDSILTGLKAFGVALGIAAVALSAIKIRGMFDSLRDLFKGRQGSKGNPMYVKMDGMDLPGGKQGPAERAARTAIDDSQLVDKNGKPLRGAAREAKAAKLAREARAAEEALASSAGRKGIMGKAGGMLGKAGGILGKAGKFIPGVGWLMTAGMAAAEGIGAYNDAENIMGIKGRQATTGEKLTAGAAGALSSLTFGLVDTKTIASGLSKTFSVVGDTLKPVIEGGKQVVSAVFSPFVAVGKLVTDNWETLANIGKNMIGVVTDLIKIAFFPLIAVGKLIYRNWDSIVSVGKQVVNVVFWPFIQIGKLVYNGWDKLASLFKTGLGYLDAFWSKIRGFTSWIADKLSWFGGDDDEKKPEPAKPADQKPPAKPADQKPAPKPQQPPKETGSSWFSAATNWLFGSDEEEKPAAPAPSSGAAPPPKPQQNNPTDEKKKVAEKTHDAAKVSKGAADTSRKSADLDAATTKRNREIMLFFNQTVMSFGKIVTSEGLIVASFGKIVVAFKEAVTKFSDCITTLSTAIQNMGTGPGSPVSPITGETVPQNVRGNLENIAKALRQKGFGDENYINAVLGNVMKESGGRMDKVEDIEGYKNTDNARIRNIFKSKTRGMSDAELTALKADPQAFANKMYGDRGGNKQPGDGWKYRGRGPIQLTGRGNYAKASKDIYGDDRLVQNPDLVLQPEVGVQVVAWFMHENEKTMRSKLGFDKNQMLSKQEAALLATSQIAGQAIKRGSGYLGTENLSKVESYASQMPTKTGAGGTWGPDTNSNLAVGKSDGDISALGRDLQKKGIRVSEHPDFGGVRGKHAGRAHYEGRALDLNIVAGRDVDDPRAAEIFDNLKPELMRQGFTTLWRVGGHYDHMHVQKGADGVKAGTSGVVAAKGGVFDGSKGGYPATLHGTELVAPLNVDSILMRMAKTPADADTQASDMISKIGGSTKNVDTIVERMMSKDNEVVAVLSNKLDKMIDILENGNDTRTKILKHSRV